MNYFILVVVFMTMPILARADLVRLYCLADGKVWLEKRQDESFSPENKIKDLPVVIMQESEMPQYESFEQLRCSGNRISVDSSYISPKEAKKKRLKELNKSLDSELAKSVVDPVAVIRIQREIEKEKTPR